MINEFIAVQLLIGQKNENDPTAHLSIVNHYADGSFNIQNSQNLDEITETVENLLKTLRSDGSR